MPIYTVNTRINSDVPPDYLRYDLCIYRLDKDKIKNILVDVQKKKIRNDYRTQNHTTSETEDGLAVIYIVEMVLYRQNMLESIRVTASPFTRMYTLEELTSDKAYSADKRENLCYYETAGVTKSAQRGVNTEIRKVSMTKRPFIAKEYPEGSSLDPFKQSEIDAQIFSRFHHMDFPSQEDTSLCGPAAFFYCLQRDRPDVYAQAARDLARYGKTKIGKLSISPGDGCRHPEGTFYRSNGTRRISGLDWMTLAGLRDSENAVLNFDVVDSPMAGITVWQTLAEWFERAGYQQVFSNVGLTQADVKGIRDLNEYIGKGYTVVTLINDGLLNGSLSVLTVPTHWIVWEGPVTEDANGNIHLNLFSWGKVNNWIKEDKNVQYFVNRFFGGMVFEPSK